MFKVSNHLCQTHFSCGWGKFLQGKSPRYNSSRRIILADFSSICMSFQLSFSDRLLFVVRLSVRLSSENFLCFHLLLSRTSGPMSTKLTEEHSWIKWIQVCSKEGPRPFSRGDNIAKMQNHGNFQLNLVKSIHG